MSKLMVKIVNVETGEELEREMNESEVAQFEIDQAAELENKAKLVAKETAKAALFERLGITEEEAKLLLG